ncbi:hypothetical protein R3P38DRAFT_3285746 [Favolaschia claudopus]|uniref:Uncharacterized protein n=1 Tax=Favolaschia claudopus TaxID=2862362 RepID=A0AAW0A3U7_9AGAR
MLVYRLRSNPIYSCIICHCLSRHRYLTTRRSFFSLSLDLGAILRSRYPHYRRDFAWNRYRFSTLCEIRLKGAQYPLRFMAPLTWNQHSKVFWLNAARGYSAWSLNASFSRLECLEIQTEKDINLGDANDWVEPLRSAPILVKYCLRYMYYEQSCDLNVRPLPVTHTSLQQLHLSRAWDEATPRGPENSMFFDILDVAFISFLTRSSPPLKTLRITAPILPGAIVCQCFRLGLMPNLENLIIDSGRCGRFTKIMGMENAPTLLLALRHLTLVPDQLSPEDGELVVKMLNVRRAHTQSLLQSFRLVYSLPDDADAVVGLRRLAREGLEIRVGEAGGVFRMKEVNEGLSKIGMTFTENMTATRLL